jgi:hypothetical protein
MCSGNGSAPTRAHFRPVDRDQETKLRGLCKDVTLCIARAAKIQADSEAPERLLPPAELLAGDKDPSELLASLQNLRALARRGGVQAVTDEQLATVERSLLDLIFEQGAYPDESDVDATAIHWRFDEWERAPETEVLAWQVYAPREPVPRGSTTYLAIRYNPAALRARPAVKRNAKPPFDSRPRRGSCQVVELSSARISEFEFHVDPQGWTCSRHTLEGIVEYEGQCEVRWFGESDPEGWRNPWVRAQFVVTRRRRTRVRRQS